MSKTKTKTEYRNTDIHYLYSALYRLREILLFPGNQQFYKIDKKQKKILRKLSECKEKDIYDLVTKIKTRHSKELQNEYVQGNAEQQSLVCLESWLACLVKLQETDLVILLKEITTQIIKDLTPLLKNTLLSLASQNGCVNVVESLLSNGADFKVTNNNLETPLHLASKNGHADVVKSLLDDENVIKSLFENSHILSPRNKDFETPLHLALHKGHVSIAKFLIEKGADVNAVANLKLTPLHLAVEKSYLEIVRLLIEKGADVNVYNYKSETPLHLAVEGKRLGIFKLLIEQGADLKVKTYSSSYTVFDLLAPFGPLDMAKFVLSKYDNLQTIFDEVVARNFLKLAIQHSCVEIVQILLSKYANFRGLIGGEFGRKLLHLAVKESSLEIVRALLSYGVDVNDSNIDMETALHLAVRKGCLEIVDFLLSQGADVNALNNKKETALNLAIKMSNTAIYDSIMNYKIANENKQNNDANNADYQEQSIQENISNVDNQNEPINSEQDKQNKENDLSESLDPNFSEGGEQYEKDDSNYLSEERVRSLSGNDEQIEENNLSETNALSFSYKKDQNEVVIKETTYINENQEKKNNEIEINTNNADNQRQNKKNKQKELKMACNNFVPIKINTNENTQDNDANNADYQQKQDNSLSLQPKSRQISNAEDKTTKSSTVKGFFSGVGIGVFVTCIAVVGKMIATTGISLTVATFWTACAVVTSMLPIVGLIFLACGIIGAIAGYFKSNTRLAKNELAKPLLSNGCGASNNLLDTQLQINCEGENLKSHTKDTNATSNAYKKLCDRIADDSDLLINDGGRSSPR